MNNGIMVILIIKIIQTLDYKMKKKQMIRKESLLHDIYSATVQTLEYYDDISDREIDMSILKCRHTILMFFFSRTVC